MAETVITLNVLRTGPRTDQVLATLAQRLDREVIEPDSIGRIHLRISGRGPRAWELVHDGLEAAGPDWRQWVHLGPRPPR